MRREVAAIGGNEAIFETMVDFLLRHYSDQLRSIIRLPDSRLHYSLVIAFSELLDFSPPLAHLLFTEPTSYLSKFDSAAQSAQGFMLEDLTGGSSSTVKDYVHVRVDIAGSPLEFPGSFSNELMGEVIIPCQVSENVFIPGLDQIKFFNSDLMDYFCLHEETFPRIGLVKVKHRDILLTLKGTVIRSGAVKTVDGERSYECQTCKGVFPVYPELEAGNVIRPPLCCLSDKSTDCEGTKFKPIENSTKYHDYQEIKIQESTQLLGVGAIPRSIRVILRTDLVDTVNAGDDVIVTGVLTAKWSSDMRGVRCDLEPVLVANHVRRTNELKSEIYIPDDIVVKFKQFWEHFKDTPLKGRNAILRGICPQVFGLFTVKLAVFLTLIGGVQHADASGTKVRGESHILLVGDPGTGKSQFLKFAAKLSNRAVITTGLGSTSAGLTVTAVKDSGEWMLEAGALVLADGGLCCIDEFDSMREHDRATIHEAMEQQTISIAKAGLVTTLNTRTIVFGATNPKGQYDPSQPLSVNTTLSGPLLSRFDIVLVLLDTKNPEWDKVVSSHILSNEEDSSKSKRRKDEDDLTSTWTLPMLRKYIHYVKEHFKPVLTREAERIIKCYYQLQRRSGVQNAARTTVRMLESLIRLAQAHARLMFRNEVTQLDAITAILCIESSMTTSAIVDDIGNALHSNFLENPDVEYAKQERFILDKLRAVVD